MGWLDVPSYDYEGWLDFLQRAYLDVLGLPPDSLKEGPGAMANVDQKQLIKSGKEAANELIDQLKKPWSEGFTQVNRDKQRAILQKAAKRQEEPNPSSIMAALIRAFQEIHPGVRPGRIVRIKAGARYNVTKPGTLVLISRIKIPQDAIWLENLDLKVIGYGLNEEGRVAFDANVFEYKIRDLEPLEAAHEIKILETWITPEPKYEPLFDGDPVELTQDTVRIMESFFGTYSQKLPKGLAGVVDVPDLQMGASANDINTSRDDRPKMKIEVFYEISGLKLQLHNYLLEAPREGHGFTYKIYIPKFRKHIECHRSLIQKRPFRKDLWRDLEIPDHLRRKVLECVHGANSNELEAWGVTDHMTKGKGSIMLFWGAPGTGKTMCAEALAEFLEKPLYIVDSSILGTDLQQFEGGLKETIDRAKRWKAVVLWDEAEIYLKQRGEDTDQNQRVAAMLRHLETFEGIMALTTNRPVELDFAIDSRIHLKMFFKQFNPGRREKIWEVTIPANMPVRGLAETLPQLCQIDLNGREIKTAILNAARQARFEKLDHVPAKYILQEASDLFESSQMLRTAREKGDDWAAYEQKQRDELPSGNVPRQLSAKNGNGTGNGADWPPPNPPAAA